MDKESIYTRTEQMLGEGAVARLKSARVAVFGVGGVGGFAAEALARAGVGYISLIDSDTVAPSNLNRQIIATHSTLGMSKVKAMMQRIVDINPNASVKTHELFFSEESAPVFDFSDYDYVLDCIDSVKSKLLLIELATRSNTPIISAMGAGNKLDPTRFSVTDISKTHGDPLARVVRTELRRRGIEHLKVVFSPEEPINPERRRTPGSISFVPSVMGLIMAGEVIKDIAIKD